MPSVSLADARAPLIVALDAGTSSVRALAFDSLGRAIGETEEQLPYALETTADGGATFPAEPLVRSDRAGPSTASSRASAMRPLASRPSAAPRSGTA